MKTESALSLEELELLEEICIRRENALAATSRGLPSELANEFPNELPNEWQVNLQNVFQNDLRGIPEPTRRYFVRELLWQDIELRQRRGETVARADYSFADSSDNQIADDVFAELKHDQAAQPDLTVNDQLPPRYQKIKEVGQGGIGSVWRVHDRHSQRPLAIKTLRK
ncbi:MAG: hypothetical protein WBD31_16030, partial [Rubripirellula sp.]